MKSMTCWLAALVLCCGIMTAGATAASADEPEKKAPTPLRTLPYQGRVQRALGPPDTREVKAHTGPTAAEASAAVGAEAYAAGKDVAFGSGGVDPETVASEAVHVVQPSPGKEVTGQED